MEAIPTIRRHPAAVFGFTTEPTIPFSSILRLSAHLLPPFRPHPRRRPHHQQQQQPVLPQPHCRPLSTKFRRVTPFRFSTTTSRAFSRGFVIGGTAPPARLIRTR